jgi:hypothetical protein
MRSCCITSLQDEAMHELHRSSITASRSTAPLLLLLLLALL